MAGNPGKETDPLELSFDKAFPQSDELDAVRDIQNIIYSYSRKGLFNLLSILIGMVLALAWGLLLGLIQFLLIWFVHPFLVCFVHSCIQCLCIFIANNFMYMFIYISILQKVVKLLYGPAAEIVGVIMDAIYGKCLSNIASRQYFNWGENDNNNNNDNIIPQQPVIYAVADPTPAGNNVQIQQHIGSAPQAPHVGVPLTTDGPRGV